MEGVGVCNWKCFDMKLKNKTWLGSLVLLTVFTGCFLIYLPQVQALGISPPWVINHELLRGTHFEKTVTITRGAAKEPLHATAEILVPPKFKDWISFEPGSEFTLPVVKQFPVKVIVDVPQDAELGYYEGQIRIRTSPEQKEGEQPQVTIGIGVAIAIDLRVIDVEMTKYNVATWEIKPVIEGRPVKIIFGVKNMGNVEVKPIRVELNVYNQTKTERLTSAKDTDFNYVDPFKRGDIIAEFPVDLEVGSYFADIKFYKDEEEVLSFGGVFTVVEGTVLQKITKNWLLWCLIGIVLIIIAVVIIGFFSEFKFTKISIIFKNIKKRFKKFKKKYSKLIKVIKEKEK